MINLIIVFTFLFIIGWIVWWVKPSKIQITSDSIKIGKGLSVEILFNNIQDLNLNSQFPNTIRRVYGTDLGDVKKGIFETDDGRQIRLHIYQEYPPFIEVMHKGGLLVFNTIKPEKTKRLFDELNSKVNPPK